MPKYGGPGRARQKCIKRQCLFLSKILQQEMAAELKAGVSGMALSQQELVKEMGGVAVSEGLLLEKTREAEGEGSAESAEDRNRQ